MQTHEENENGLLEHQLESAPENEFNPGQHLLVPSPEAIEAAASESHHGVVREKTAPRIGREEEAKLALEHTEISRAVGWLLTLAFIITIFSVPLVQSILEVRENLATRQKERNSSALTATGVLPHAFDALQELPTRNQIEGVSNWRDAWSLIPEADRLKAHEDTLENDSFLTKWMLPRVSGVLLKAGVGNEQVFLGRRDAGGHQWLFYRPDVDYLSSKGFLDPMLQRVRERAGDASSPAIQPDPLRAILDFQKQLAARNIQLVIMPVPVKPMLEAVHLSTHKYEKTDQLQNPSYLHFLQSLKSNGVLIFDPTSILQARKTKTKQSQFLRSDTHWTPSAMQEVARGLAEFLGKRVAFSDAHREYSQRQRSIENQGDIATMLTLPDNQTFVLPQKVQIESVYDARGALWKSDKNAEVLLLGDSFFNIYTLPEMGWGQGAGFAPQLSRFLKRPTDAVVVNAGGSFSSRQRLVGEMQNNTSRLQNTKVVVWEFSMRDLLSGDWKILPLPSGETKNVLKRK